MKQNKRPIPGETVTEYISRRRAESGSARELAMSETYDHLSADADRKAKAVLRLNHGAHPEADGKSNTGGK